MTEKKLALTDFITLGEGIVWETSIVGPRRLFYDRTFSGFLLLENGDNILEEDGDDLLSEQFKDSD